MKLWSLFRVDSAMMEGALQALQAGHGTVWKRKTQCKSEVQSRVFSIFGRQLCIVLSNSRLLRMKGVVGYILLLKP